MKIYDDPLEAFAALRSHLGSTKQARILCCYRGDSARLCSLLSTDIESYLYIGEAGAEFARRCSVAKVNSLLGQEYARVILDCTTAGVSAQALGIAAGLVLKGGGLLLCLPSSYQVNTMTTEVDRFAITRGDFVESLFERRLLESIASFEPENELAISAYEAEQAVVVKSIVSTARGRANRPLVLTADRGRGKSYALGLAIVALLKAKPDINIVVTSVVRSALGAVYCALSDHGVDHSRVPYLPIDTVILAAAPEGVDVLFVDEAAAVSVPQLIELTTRYRRIIFSTTLHGYEGSGRGFTHRFFKALDQLRPQWRRATLSVPIRWLPGDPLESFVDQALLLQAEPRQQVEIGRVAEAKVLFKELTAALLIADEELLTQYFGLLVGAHYQTTPDDLRMLLDSTAIKRYALFVGDAIVAVCLVAVEGVDGDDIDCEEVWQGRRRTRGQLVPQQLISSYRLFSTATLRSIRVMRIAVHYDYQRQGLGRRLLREVTERSRLEGADFISSSFGANAELLGFWVGEDFLPVKLGFRKDTASGEHSAIVLRPLTEVGEKLVAQARALFVQAFPFFLVEQFVALEPALVSRLLVGTYVQGEGDIIAPAKAYALASNSYDNCSSALYAIALLALSADSKLPSEATAVLVLKLLQRRSWVELIQRLGFSGIKQAEGELKSAIRLCLSTPVVTALKQEG